jgi:hypothetical protein
MSKSGTSVNVFLQEVVTPNPAAPLALPHNATHINREAFWNRYHGQKADGKIISQMCSASETWLRL